jgi:hypothetical protein
MIVKDEEFTPLYKYLFAGRLAFIHNLILGKPVNSLAGTALDCYLKYTESYAKGSRVLLTHFIATKMEFANVLLFYYKYSEAERCLEICKQVLNVDVEYTGRMGRRTKYQKFEPYKGKSNEMS